MRNIPMLSKLPNGKWAQANTIRTQVSNKVVKEKQLACAALHGFLKNIYQFRTQRKQKATGVKLPWFYVFRIFVSYDFDSVQSFSPCEEGCCTVYFNNYLKLSKVATYKMLGLSSQAYGVRLQLCSIYWYLTWFWIIKEGRSFGFDYLV